MTHRIFSRPSACSALVATLVLVSSLACGGSSSTPAPAASSTPAPAASPAARPAAPATLTAIEPSEGLFSGHVDTFRWSPVEGADGYRFRLNAVVDGRTVWESPVLTTTEAQLPKTIALEPEGYTWQVTALKGSTPLTTSSAFRFTITP